MLMRVVDGLENLQGGRPWEPMATGPFGDTMPTSIINRRHPELYISSGGYGFRDPQPAFVLDSALAKSRINCMYPQDAGSVVSGCEEKGGGGLLSAYQDLTAAPIASLGKGCVWNQRLGPLLQEAGLEVLQRRSALGGLLSVIEATPVA